MKTEGRNAVLELLKTDKNIDKILLEKNPQGSLFHTALRITLHNYLKISLKLVQNWFKHGSKFHLK